MLDITITRVVRLANSLPELTSGIRLHLFGSALSTREIRNDTDILLVYPVGRLAEAHQLAEHLRSLDISPPVSVIALNYEEENETQFIEGVGAVQFWQGTA